MFPICCFSGSDSSQAVPSLLQAAGPGQSYSLLVLICSLVCLLLAKSLGIKCALMHSVRASDASQPVLSYQFHLKGDLSSTSLLPLLKHTTHHLMVFISTLWSPSVNECQRLPFFSACRSSVTPFCSIRISVSDTNLSDCPSAVSCHTATKRNGTLTGRFNPYCHTISIHL